MADGGALGEAGASLPAAVSGRAEAPVERPLAVAAAYKMRLEEVELLWRQFENAGVWSPGQSYAFTRLWIETLAIPEADQLFIVGAVNEVPIALLALRRHRVGGVTVLTWFPGNHVGCNAPLADQCRLAQLSASERRNLWQQMLSVAEADLVHLRSVPVCEVDGVDIFAELGNSIAGDVLYRAAFASWNEADATQRSRSRRKHDRQQGERLEALGEVSFEELGPGPAAAEVLDQMFRQRAARFRQMGVDDPFNGPVRRFYEATVAPGSRVPVRLHVLRLDGAVVAVRYNVVHGDRLFCLVSSMSEDPEIRCGSPGKQCLLRVMQQVFDAGARVFDMGEGLTDEKRHWCNEQLPLRHHYLPLTPKGAAAAWLHRSWQVQRRRIKTSPALLRVAKALRSARPDLLRQGNRP